MYMVTAPWWLRLCYPSLVWQIRSKEKNIYLTFDDGPHPVITNYVLDELKKYNALATFFCIGKNVELHTQTYNRILAEGHAVGNHTYNHTNGWKVSKEMYLADVQTASSVIQSSLFRPPYGRISRQQIKQLSKQYRIIMWSVLSGDFDKNLSPQKCWQHVISNTSTGSIIVFHDSEKAFERLQVALPETLQFFAAKGYSFKSLTT